MSTPEFPERKEFPVTDSVAEGAKFIEEFMARASRVVFDDKQTEVQTFDLLPSAMDGDSEQVAALRLDYGKTFLGREMILGQNDLLYPRLTAGVKDSRSGKPGYRACISYQGVRIDSRVARAIRRGNGMVAKGVIKECHG